VRCALAWDGIEDPIQEFKFPQRKFSASKRDYEIFAGELRFFQCMCRSFRSSAVRECRVALTCGNPLTCF
jgi:hypothetical protein